MNNDNVLNHFGNYLILRIASLKKLVIDGVFRKDEFFNDISHTKHIC